MTFSIRFLVALAFLAFAVPALSGVRDSLHNLSASGPGSVRAASADRICEFCHISHSASPVGGLWSRGKSSAAYIPYSSSTAVARPGQPTGTSVLCLSCHDGTIALGEIVNRGAPHSMAGGNNRMPQGKGLQGTDLRDDHPISFQYSANLATQNGELAMPGAIGPNLRLDQNGELQCTTCHEAHSSPYEKLLRMPNIRSQLCTECHQETGWPQSSHSQSFATWNGQRPDPWQSSPYTTVSDNGCQNCHVPHNEAGGPRLLIHAAEEDNCSDCHNGNVASKDVMASFNLVSSHRVEDTTLIHDPVEPVVIDVRHVECADCHDPHATRAARSEGDTPANVRGVSLSGTEVRMATQDYEICLRCHGDSPNQPSARIPRQHDQLNMRLKIQLNNPSFHPVAGPGVNSDVPSLIAPLNEQSVIGCIGCHNSNAAESVGGSGPEGPHGSRFEPILARNYSTLDNTPESASAYSLCYGCHSRDSVLNDESFG
ncbi:MAG: cytochrome c3 family protein, partial [Gammaproteobacteria bacterium]|nr:cytochrome c3 family protein [Gammaproteobacteria bacterium]